MLALSRYFWKSKKSATELDVFLLYNAFFGRDPENKAVVREKIKQDRIRLIASILQSKEFDAIASDNFRKIIRQGVPLNIQARLWAAQFFPLSSDGVLNMSEAEYWPDLYSILLRDHTFAEAIGAKSHENFTKLASFVNANSKVEFEKAGPAPAPAAGSPLQFVSSFDAIEAGTASGWIWESHHPDTPVKVEIFAGGRSVGEGVADIFRQDIKDAGFGSGFCSFRIKIDSTIPDGSEVRAFIKGTSLELHNSPRIAKTPAPIKRLFERQKKLTSYRRARIQNFINKKPNGHLISIIMPTYNTKPEWLIEAIESVKNQIYTKWELICIDDASPNPEVCELISLYAASDSRIRLIRQGHNRGIAASVNAGLFNAKGSYVAFLDHDDYIEPDAIYELNRAISTDVGLIYSDELLTSENISSPLAMAARPAFSYEYYLSHPYFVHLVCVHKDLALSIGGWDESMSISADVDFILRAIEKSKQIVHIPKILYRWRTHDTSTGHSRKDSVTAATVAALNRHLDRVGSGAKANATNRFNVHRISFKDNRDKVTIIIPTKNRLDLLKPCIESILKTVPRESCEIVVIDHKSDDAETRRYLDKAKRDGIIEIFRWEGIFNYAAMHNAAVRALTKSPDLLVFMNNDIEAIEPGWFEEMRSLATRKDVGIVGATLIYQNKSIQHGGVIVGMGGLADHAFRLQPLDDDRGFRNGGYLESLISTRQYSAVTAACMMMRTEVFEGVGGFDEDLTVGFNDTDLCLRVGETGLKILNTPNAVLFHYESATRSPDKQIEHPDDSNLFKKKWATLLADGDPFYNPSLELWGVDHFPSNRYNPRAKNRCSPGLAAGVDDPRSFG